MSVGTTYDFGDTNLYVVGTMSAQVVVDRTKFYEGDALKELTAIKGKDGLIDHTTLPPFAKGGDDSRDLGAMVSMLTVAVQQLANRLDKVENK
jgi:hypothetical protein